MKKYLLFITMAWMAIAPSQIVGQSNEPKNDIDDKIVSKILDETRDITIHLPNDGVLNPSESYPVVYVLDGGVQMSVLKTIYENYWGHHLPKMILVGINNRQNRTRDLTPSEVKFRNGANMNEPSGGADKFTEFIEKELIPHIDQKYQTTSYRTLIGHSYGGLFAINTLINHPNLFNNYIAIDPSLDWDNQKVLSEAKRKLSSKKFSDKSLYLALAGPLSRSDDDLTMDDLMKDQSEFSLFSRSVVEFSDLAEKSDLNFSWHFYNDDLHGTVPMPSMIDGLLFLFNWYPVTNFGKFNDPATPLKELKQLIKSREELLESHFGYVAPPADEELLAMAAQMYGQIGQNDKKEAFLKMNVGYYPKSVNAFTQLIEYYLSTQDKPNVMRYLNIAEVTFSQPEVQAKISQIKSMLGE